MECYIQSIDFDLRDIILDGFSYKPKQSWSTYDERCFSLNIRAMQILRNNLYVYAYYRIRSCSCAKDIWDGLNAIFLPNNEFVHKVESEEQNSLKEAYSP